MQTQKQKVHSLQESLARKECELASLEERYKKYVEKAKSVIKILDPKQAAAQSPSELRAGPAAAAGAEASSGGKPSKELRIIRDMEEKLMISTFYHYGLTRHREAVDQRLAALTSGQGQSFLARQRQPTPRKIYSAYNSK